LHFHPTPFPSAQPLASLPAPPWRRSGAAPPRRTRHSSPYPLDVVAGAADSPPLHHDPITRYPLPPSSPWSSTTSCCRCLRGLSSSPSSAFRPPCSCSSASASPPRTPASAYSSSPSFSPFVAIPAFLQLAIDTVPRFLIAGNLIFASRPLLHLSIARPTTRRHCSPDSLRRGTRRPVRRHRLTRPRFICPAVTRREHSTLARSLTPLLALFHVRGGPSSHDHWPAPLAASALTTWPAPPWPAPHPPHHHRLPQLCAPRRTGAVPIRRQPCITPATLLATVSRPRRLRGSAAHLPCGSALAAPLRSPWPAAAATRSPRWSTRGWESSPDHRVNS